MSDGYRRFDAERRAREAAVDRGGSGSRARRRPTEEHGQSVENALRNLLESMGVAPVAEHDAVCAAAQAAIAETGLRAEVRSLRHRELVIAADRSAAALLKWHTEQIHDACAKASPGTVQTVKVIVGDDRRPNR